MSTEDELKNYKEIQKYLETQIKNNDFSSIEQYVNSHKRDIMEIYFKFGSGNEYLRSPYDGVCMKNPDIALKYQVLLESVIDKDVLFTDE
jgi:hypothetical protein